MALTLDGTNGIVSSGSITTQSATGVIFSDSSSLPAASSPFSLKNRIINGDMRIDQRNAGAAVNNINGAGFFITDRWKSMAVNSWASSGVVFSGQQNRDSLTPPTGFTNYLGIATTTQSTSLPATATLDLTQVIEGFNMADLGWGTANAKTVTLSFWVRSNLTGTFGGSLINSGYNRVYVFSYTISAADTWEYKTVTIAGDTSGTWVTNNGIGITLSFSLGAGSSMMTTPGSWGSSLVSAPTGQQQICASTANRFYVTGVQLEQNTSATPFERRLYGQELINCQRYFKMFANGTDDAIGLGTYYSATAVFMPIVLPVEMRATPTVYQASLTSQFTIYRNSNNDPFNSFSIDGSSTNKAVEVFNNTEIASATVGWSGMIRTFTNAGCYFGLEAEL
jgi:hypothetical protein